MGRLEGDAWARAYAPHVSRGALPERMQQAAAQRSLERQPQVAVPGVGDPPQRMPSASAGAAAKPAARAARSPSAQSGSAASASK